MAAHKALPPPLSPIGYSGYTLFDLAADTEAFLLAGFPIAFQLNTCKTSFMELTYRTTILDARVIATMPDAFRENSREENH